MDMNHTKMNETMDMNAMHDHDMLDGNTFSGCNLIANTSSSSIIWIITNILILISTIPFIFKFFGDHFKHKYDEKQPVYLFYAGIVFVIITFIVLLSDSISIIFFHCNHLWYMIFMLLFGFTYILQIILVLIIFFFRVYYVFKTSDFQLSKNTIFIYTVLFISIPIIFGVVEFWYHISHHSPISSKVLAICYLFNILCMLSLLILFSSKLMSTYKSLPSIQKTQSDTHQMLIRIITRSTVLTAISLIFTLIASIAFIIIDQITITHRILVALLVNIDVYTNFICILLSYSYFNEFYYKLCGFIDKRCTSFCDKNTSDSINMTQIVRNTTNDPSKMSANTSTPTVTTPNTGTSNTGTPNTGTPHNINSFKQTEIIIIYQ